MNTSYTTSSLTATAGTENPVASVEGVTPSASSIDSPHTEAITASIRELAQKALTATGGRTTYEYIPSTGREAGAMHGTGTGPGSILVSLEIVRAQENVNTDPVFLAKEAIVWLLLDPTLDLAGEVSRRNKAIAPAQQDVIRARLLEVLEQKILQNPRSGGLDLEMLVHPTPRFDKDGAPVIDKAGQPVLRPIANPVGWARQLLAGSVNVVTQRVLIADPSDLNDFGSHDNHEDKEIGIIRREIRLRLPSAEDSYLAGDTATDIEVLARWQERTQNKRGQDLTRVSARALLDQYGVPALIAPESGAEILALALALEESPALARVSLEVCDGLADLDAMTGSATLDDALLSLWDDYTAQDRASLLDAPAKVTLFLVQASLTLPEKPNRDIVRMAKMSVRGTSPARGWTGLSIRAMDSYIANTFALSSRDYVSVVDNGERLALAALWPALAQEVLDHVSRPAGSARTISEVGAWFGSALTTV